MFLRSWLSAWLISISAHLVTGDLAQVCDSNSRPTHGGFCGDRLPEIRKTACALGLGRFRRATQDVKLIDADHAQQTFLTQRLARSFLEGSSPKRGGTKYQGITCECCHNRCSIGELMEYCPHRQRLRVTKKAYFKPIRGVATTFPGATASTSSTSELEKTREIDEAASGDSEEIRSEWKKFHEGLYLTSLFAKNYPMHTHNDGELGRGKGMA